MAWDRYAYTSNNPVRYIDPTGHAQACADGDEGGRCGSTSPKALLSLGIDDPQKAIRNYIRDHPRYHPEYDPAVREDRSVYSEVAIAMMQVSQEGNRSTILVGGTVTGGNTVIGRADAFYATDTEGNGAWMYDYGGGASFPPIPFASGGTFISVTNAPSIDKLTGLGTATGGTVGALNVFGISMEVDKIPDSESNKIYTGLSLEISFTASLSPLAGWVYTTATTTNYIPNIFGR